MLMHRYFQFNILRAFNLLFTMATSRSAISVCVREFCGYGFSLLVAQDQLLCVRE